VTGRAGVWDVVEAELFLRADPARIAAILADPDWQVSWSQGLRLHPYQDRGSEGLRAVVTGVLEGSCEWWVEPVRPEGAVVHFWLRPVRRRRPWWLAGPLQRRRALLHRRAVGRRWRAALLRLKTTLEPRAGGAVPRPADPG